MDNTHTYRTHSSEETKEIAGKMASYIRNKGQETRDKKESPVVICLYGDLGSGKTTFAQGFAQGLGVTSRVISPTFLLMREHDIDSKRKFYHLDVYRTTTTDTTLNFSEIFNDSDSIVLIEWADRIKEKLPEKRIDVFFELNDDDTHTIKLCYPST